MVDDDDLRMRDLKWFCAVADCGGVSAAASSLGVSQPAVTYAVRRLESQIGCAVIVHSRSHGEVRLTPAGEMLLRHARLLLREMRMLRRDVDVAGGTPVRLGVPPIIGRRFFPRIAKILMDEGLMSSVQLVEGGSSYLMDCLTKGSVDLSLLGSLQSIDNGFCRGNTLMKVPFCVVAAAGSEESGIKSTNFEYFSDRDFVLLDEGYVHSAAFSIMSTRTGIHPRVGFRSKDLDIVKSSVRSGVGLGFLCPLAFDSRDGLIPIRLDDEGCPMFYVSVAFSVGLASPRVEKVGEIIGRAIGSDRLSRNENSFE